MICPKCKKETSDDSKFCEFCGATFTTEQVEEQSNSANKRERFSLDNVIKISLAVAILVASFSVAYYFIIYLPQKDKLALEQQAQQLAKEQELKQEEFDLQKQKDKIANLQHQQDYIAKRKNDCHETEVKERKDYPNVVGGSYDDTTDICTITYTGDNNKEFTQEY